ncbi:MAG: S4 domain-containing protein, partial [Bacteroidota bacterium]|nr:S4 domain-containing protein [Bacteroidota bacterium]
MRSARPFRKTDRHSSQEEGGKSYSQKSRFADKKTSPRKQSTSSPKPFGKAAPARRSSTDKSTNPRGTRRPQSGTRSEERGTSYGKPYKKIYRTRPDRTGAAPVHKRHQKEADPETKSDKIRLNKYIANSGISSRREADELIKMGLISVNGNIVSELGYKVSPGDEVRYEAKVL